LEGHPQEQPKLSLEQWRLTTDNGDHSLEQWRLVMEPGFLPKSVEVILKLFRSSWSCRRSTWRNGGMPWLTLEQWRLTLELWRLTQEQ
jgi:hypothetical protein